MSHVFFEQVHDFFHAGRVDDAMDLIYDTVDDLMLRGDSADVWLVLEWACDSRVPPLVALVGMLTISLPWRVELREVRQRLADRVRREAIEAGGVAKADAVLAGLL